ncbi:MAG TPA: AAA-like domain-containing protein [Candidatus Cloacimonadota bacterium]|nr:AAA-like domain-containing protein [Candidatus Cloacimonadota bacterium]
MKFFNTAGPVNRPQHYKVDPLHRWNLDEVLSLIQEEKYFILHAPRQTGKTSSLLALQEYLNNEGKYLAVYANVEAGQASRNDIKSAMKAIITEIANRLAFLMKDNNIFDALLEVFSKTEAENGLNSVISYICSHYNKPVVLFIDEIDALVGDTLISVLRQLRAGYDKRPVAFPSTIILCGVRDIKDYRIQTSGQDIITGGSAFNIKAKSLRLGNFSKEDVINLYTQHTSETGQKFEEACFDLVMSYTDGQPWLVNALAYEVTSEIRENRNRSITITPQMLEIAKERLILSRQTHLDQLADKLKEDRVRRLILPMIMGEEFEYNQDDANYCSDLGLIKKTGNSFQIANAIYKEIIPRELTEVSQENFLARYRPDWVNADGSINTNTLLTLFKDFWNDNSGIWASHIAGYQEAAPQLITQAFLQRVANGNGFINREYGVSRKRTDLMLKWSYSLNNQIHYQKVVMELKVINERYSFEKVRQEALIQTAEYARICGSDEAHILIFDRNNTQKWSATEPNELTEYDGVKLEIWKFSDNWSKTERKRR